MKWKDPLEWAKLKKGIDCPMCKDISLAENPFSFLVKELKYSYVRLPKNQYLRGWTIVFFKSHACELFELSKDELTCFWGEVARVAKALGEIYRPAKIDYLVFGHHCPHLHCHLVLQTFESDPSKAVKMDEKEVFLTRPEYEKVLRKLRRSLDS